jgi:hypothetical protein
MQFISTEISDIYILAFLHGAYKSGLQSKLPNLRIGSNFCFVLIVEVVACDSPRNSHAFFTFVPRSEIMPHVIVGSHLKICLH